MVTLFYIWYEVIGAAAAKPLLNNATALGPVQGQWVDTRDEWVRVAVHV